MVSAANVEQGFGPSAVATGTTQSIGKPGCLNCTLLAVITQSPSR